MSGQEIILAYKRTLIRTAATIYAGYFYLGVPTRSIEVAVAEAALLIDAVEEFVTTKVKNQNPSD